jgi:hypothetical protein
MPSRLAWSLRLDIALVISSSSWLMLLQGYEYKAQRLFAKRQLTWFYFRQNSV